MNIFNIQFSQVKPIWESEYLESISSICVSLNCTSQVWGIEGNCILKLNLFSILHVNIIIIKNDHLPHPQGGTVCQGQQRTKNKHQQMSLQYVTCQISQQPGKNLSPKGSCVKIKVKCQIAQITPGCLV